MATTFRALAEHADFSAEEPSPRIAEEDEEAEPVDEGGKVPSFTRQKELALHNDVHVHLPSTSDVAVYTAIFRALREELLD